MKPGGTEGGTGHFLTGLGLALLALGLYLFLDSVRVTSGDFGLLSRGMRGFGTTTSMGLIFVPFFLGVTVLFVNSEKPWAWWLTLLGLLLIIVEIVSRIQFSFSIKTSHLLLIIILSASGAGFIAKAYLEDNETKPS